MRNPDRIESFLKEIGDLWKENCPDWRFGQLMFNFFSALGDPFYYEEDEFLEAFKAYFKREDPKEAVRKYREQKIDKAAEAKLKEKMDDFWKNFNLAEFEAKLKKEMEEIDSEKTNFEDDLK